MAIVEIRPIPRERWHKKTGKDSFTRPVKIHPSVDPFTSKYKIDLEPEELAKLQEDTKYDLSLEFKEGVPHPFWGQSVGKVKLENGANIFRTERPLDLIKIGIAKGSPLVANSMAEYEEGKYPDAIFVIFDEREEIEVKAKKDALRRKAEALIDSLTSTQKQEIVQICLDINTSKQSTDFIDVKFSEAIKIVGAEKILFLAERKKETNTLHALVLKGLQKNVFRKEGSSIYYLTDQIGHDVESAVAYLQDKNNQTLKAIIIDKIKN